MKQFDTIFLNVTCPYCEETSRMDCRTVDLFCVHHNYEVNDKLDDDLSDIHTIYAIGSCHSQECLGSADLGKAFPMTIFMEDGIITSKYKILPEFW